MAVVSVFSGLGTVAGAALDGDARAAISRAVDRVSRAAEERLHIAPKKLQAFHRSVLKMKCNQTIQLLNFTEPCPTFAPRKIFLNTQTTTAFKPQDGMFELSLMNAEASETNFDDIVVNAISRGIPVEVITRLKELWNKVQMIAGEVVAIGRIIVNHIFEFLKRNPKLSFGLALGVALSVLIGGIPIIGPLLQPFATWVATLYGAGVGAAMQKGDYSSSPFTAGIELASKFFELLMAIFQSVTSYWAAR